MARCPRAPPSRPALLLQAERLFVIPHMFIAVTTGTAGHIPPSRLRGQGVGVGARKGSLEMKVSPGETKPIVWVHKHWGFTI